MNKKVESLAPVAVYVLNGTENEDLNSPMSPYQGKTLAKYFKDAAGNWISVMRDGSGNPNLGYLAKEITEAEGKIWQLRIDRTRESAGAGYQDAQGLWYCGQAPGSLLLAAAYRKKLETESGAFYKKVGPVRIDALADSLTADAEIRSVEYAKRFEEAIEYQANPGTAEQYPYLHGMTYKGLTLEEAAELVIKNYQAAKVRNQKIADLRMQKNLLFHEGTAAEKEAIYSGIIAGLQALR
jgi:hypothetical protein